MKKFIVLSLLHIFFFSMLTAEPWINKDAFAVNLKGGVFVGVHGEAFLTKYKIGAVKGFNYYKKSNGKLTLLNSKLYTVSGTKNEASRRLGSDIVTIKKYGISLKKIYGLKNEKKLLEKLLRKVHTRPSIAVLLGFGFIDKTAQLGKTYEYIVKAKIGNKLIEYATVKATYRKKFIGFVKVKNYKIKQSKSRKTLALISWKPLISQNEVIGYDVYRKLKTGHRAKVNKTLIQYTKGNLVKYYIDIEKLKDTVEYSVVPVSGFGILGKFSEWLSFSPQNMLGKLEMRQVAVVKLDKWSHKGLIHISCKVKGRFNKLEIYRSSAGDRSAVLSVNPKNILLLKDNYKFYHRNNKNMLSNKENKDLLLFSDTVDMPGLYQYQVKLFDNGKEISSTKIRNAAIPDRRLAFPPTAVKVENKLNGISVKWDYNESGVGDSFILYRRLKGEKNKFSLLRKIILKEREFLDKATSPGKVYQYYLQTINKEGLYSLNSSVVAIKSKILQKPLGFGLINLIRDGNVICIKWNSKRNMRATHVIVYKNGSEEKEIPYNKGKFCDKNLDFGETVAYHLKTKNKNFESNPSTKVKYLIPYPKPYIIKDIKITQDSSVVNIDWSYDYEYIKEYYILRREQSQKKFKKITREKFEDNSYEDKSVAKGKVYYYSIIAINKGNKKSPASIPLKILIK